MPSEDGHKYTHGPPRGGWPTFKDCEACSGTGIMGGPGGYYDSPGKGKPCGTCKGRKRLLVKEEDDEAEAEE